MKRGSLTYLTKEGLRNIWSNRLMSVASITVLLSCLLMIGVSFMFFVNLQVMIDTVEEQNVIMVFINDGTSADLTKQLGRQIKAIENVKTCEYVSKEEAFAEQLSDIGDAAEFFEGIESPLPDAFKVTIVDMNKFSSTVKQLEKLENVLSLRENRDFANKLAYVRSSVSYISIGVIGLLLLVSLFIIANTIRVTMFSRRLEISIMKSVGATRWFIRWPFMIEGMVLGIFSGLLALLGVYGMYRLVSNILGSVFAIVGVSGLLPFSDYAPILLLGFTGIGIIAGSFGSIISIRKYLKEKVYDISDERTI